ncbi:ATP-binding protein [Frankia sp. AiPs1]|uniref:ATP-binding protein n=1 Tax=Frankia sp. AiPa1 TaxID=573492 RepID=UPI00202AFF04|nr:ATP-binding protein [Frankia sp. AiPa1]MCL9761616.1 ATP-binding protein [Frankia sp. AiPa1]
MELRQLSLDLFPRHAARLVSTALTDTRVVVLNGARQVGKSTLAQLAVERADGARSYYLDEEPTRAAATADPIGFLHHDGLLMIDEVQRVPELLLAIKREVDRSQRPGQFLLTGSARLWGLRGIPDTLPGRSETIELWPLAQGEIGSGPDGFVDAVFSASDISVDAGGLRRQDYIERALRGGFPEAVRRTDPRRRGRFFESYISDLIARDVRQIADIQRTAEMRRLVQALAANSSGLVVPARLSNDLNVSASTVARYIEALELVYVIRRIPAWSSNLTTRAVATPKLIFVDSGVAGHLTGMTSRRASHPTSPVGPLLENFVLGEIARQLTWAEEPISMFHYRDRDHNEVDAVLERASGEVVGIELTSSPA